MARTVRATTIDLTADRPSKSDIFLIDTNVWYWMTYTRASVSARYQVRDYPAFIAKALTAGSGLCYAPETFAELAHLIEKCEYELHLSTSGATKATLSLKDFRHEPTLRTTVVNEIDIACRQMTNIAQCIRSTRDENAVQKALTELTSHQVDGYDSFFLVSARAAGVTDIVTDDGDFVTCAGMTVFTANRNTVSGARAQGKLLVR